MSKYVDRARYDQALELWPGYERSSLQQYAYVSRKCSIRIEDLAFGHHQVVAGLPPAEQREWLEAAVRNGWTIAELRRQLRARRVPTPPLPDGEWPTIVVDPPWDVETGPGWNTGGPSRPLGYAPMDVADIGALQPPAAADAHLYLWTINAYLRDAYDIAEAWGFDPVTLLVWAKAPSGVGLGGVFAQTTEYVLFARRGELSHRQRVDRTCFTWKRGAHSVKPDGFYDLVETVSPGPYLDMFARRDREGWTVWGHEVAA